MPKQEIKTSKSNHLFAERRRAFSRRKAAIEERGRAAQARAERDAFLEDCPPLPKASERP